MAWYIPWYMGAVPHAQEIGNPMLLPEMFMRAGASEHHAGTCVCLLTMRQVAMPGAHEVRVCTLGVAPVQMHTLSYAIAVPSVKINRCKNIENMTSDEPFC